MNRVIDVSFAFCSILIISFFPRLCVNFTISHFLDICSSVLLVGRRLRLAFLLFFIRDRSPFVLACVSIHRSRTRSCNCLRRSVLERPVVRRPATPSFVNTQCALVPRDRFLLSYAAITLASFFPRFVCLIFKHFLFLNVPSEQTLLPATRGRVPWFI